MIIIIIILYPGVYITQNKYFGGGDQNVQYIPLRLSFPTSLFKSIKKWTRILGHNVL